MPLYFCPHCQTQNFYTRARVRLALKVPLECWKCRKEVKREGPKKTAGKGRERGRSGG